MKMNEDIKKIMEEWAKFLSWCYENNDKTIEVHRDNAKKVMDYITNLQEENKKLVKVIDEIEKEIWKIRQLTFTKYNSNEWDNCLSFNDDILPIITKLTELKGEYK